MSLVAYEQIGLWSGGEELVEDNTDPDRVGGAGLHAVARWLSEHPDVVARYRQKVWRGSEHGCQFWCGALNGRTGHAKVHLGYVRGRQWVEYGHRIAWILAGGALLGAGACIRHICDEASCQQPQHLMEGSSADNSRDWSSRRVDVRGPLGDARGPYGRAKAIQDAIAWTSERSIAEQRRAVTHAQAIGTAASQLLLIDPDPVANPLSGQGLNPQVRTGQGGLF